MPSCSATRLSSRGKNRTSKADIIEPRRVISPDIRFAKPQLSLGAAKGGTPPPGAFFEIFISKNCVMFQYEILKRARRSRSTLCTAKFLPDRGRLFILTKIKCSSPSIVRSDFSAVETSAHIPLAAGIQFGGETRIFVLNLFHEFL
jgi:hypothetical protein